MNRLRKNLSAVELATVMCNPTRLPVADPKPEDYELGRVNTI